MLGVGIFSGIFRGLSKKLSKWSVQWSVQWSIQGPISTSNVTVVYSVALPCRWCCKSLSLGVPELQMDKWYIQATLREVYSMAYSEVYSGKTKSDGGVARLDAGVVYSGDILVLSYAKASVFITNVVLTP